MMQVQRAVDTHVQ